MPILMKMGSVGLAHCFTSKHDSKEDRLRLYLDVIHDMLYGTLMELELIYKDLFTKQHKADVLVSKSGFSIRNAVVEVLEPHLKRIIDDCPDNELNHLRFYLSAAREDNGRYIVTFHDRSFDSPGRLPYSDYTVELKLRADKKLYNVYIVTGINNATREFIVYEDEMLACEKSASMDKNNTFIYRDNTIGLEETIVYASVQRQKKMQVNIVHDGEVKVGEVKEVKLTLDND